MRYRPTTMPRCPSATARPRARWRGSLLACLWLGAIWPVAAADNRFGWLGLPPVEVGQTLQQAQSRLGTPLVVAPGGAEVGCQRRTATTLPGVGFVVDQGVVTRIETRDPRYATVSGIRVGDEVDKVKRLYAGRLSVAPHLYFDKGLTLAVYSPDRKFALVMESNDSGRVITLRGGMVPAVEFLEGCGG